MGLAIEGVDHVTVQITDVARARRFYGDFLGLEETPRPASFDFPGAWYKAGNIMIHLVGQTEPDALSRRHFCLRVSNVFETYRIVEAAGYEAKWDQRKIPGIERFFTRDPDGNRIEFQGSAEAAGNSEKFRDNSVSLSSSSGL